MSEDETYDLIENYLSGALDKEQKSAFEKQLSTDADFTKKVRLQQLANELVIENRLLNVKNILLEEKTKGNSGNNLTKIIFGAAILLVGTLLFFTWKNKKIVSESTPVTNKLVSTSNTTTTPASEQGVIARHNNTGRTTKLVETNQIKTTEIITESETQLNHEPGVSEMIPEEKVEPTKELPPAPVQEKITNGPCATIQLSAKVATTTSCKEESNGSITVREFAGGTAPYTVNIKNKQQEYVSSLNIPAGSYTVQIQDKKGCSHTFYNIQVPEKLCEKEYTFNPFIEERFELPAQDQYGTLVIYERSGNSYFTKETEPSEIIQWNGYSKNGELNAGYFIFVLTLKDGQLIKGGITIVR